MQTPWAVLLCKFNDNDSEPFPREYYENLFTTAGWRTHNMVNFFADVSHGHLDLSGSRVFGWFPLNHPRSDYHPSGPTFNADREQLVDWARQAATNAGNDLRPFFGVVVCMNVRTDLWGGAAQDGKPVAVCDNFSMHPSQLGQEMGHGYGLAHARADGSVVDYLDNWDIMSTPGDYMLNVISMAPDPDYTVVGPGMNAWNMRGRGWLDESRVRPADPHGFDINNVELRPLLRRDLPGLLAAEAGNGFLVEFRFPEDWDAAIRRPAILVHRFQDNQSYIMRGTEGQQDLGMGEVFQMGMESAQFYPFVRVEFVNIDANSRLATVHLQFRPAEVPASTFPAWGNPAAYFTPTAPTARVVYRGDDAHIHELYFPQGDRWHHGDLSISWRTNAPSAAGKPYGYFTPVDSTARVVYRGDDGHIHELYLPQGSSWHHGDLSALSGAPNAAGEPYGYFTPVDSTARVVYRGNDGHIHELSLPQGSSWHHGDLSALSGAGDAWNAAGDPRGYFSATDGTARVVYRSNDGHIHELYLPQGSSWHHGDLSIPWRTNAPNAAGEPYGYFTPVDSTARVVYRGNDGHIHELYLPLPGGPWQHGDLSGGFDAPNPVSDPFGFFSTFDSTARVIYRSDDNHIHELSLQPNSGWEHVDLTLLAL